MASKKIKNKEKKAIRAGHRNSTESSTVLITGASGRLGRRLCSAMLADGITVRCLINQHNQMNMLPAGVVPYIGDITDRDALKKACEGADTVYHLAAIVSQHSHSPKEIVRVNAHGTAAILEASEFGGVGRFVFPSSVDVYGRVRKEVLTEESALHPTDMYGHSKMLAEQQIMKFGGRIGYTILRMATMYGPGFEGSFFKVFKMIKKGSLYIIGDGSNNLSLVHIKDVINAMILAKNSRISAYRVYNLSDGRAYTQLQLVDMAAKKLDAPVPSKHINPAIARMFSKAAGVDPDELRFITSNRVIDISRIRKELGFVPKININVATKELVDEFLRGYKDRKSFENND